MGGGQPDGDALLQGDLVGALCGLANFRDGLDQVGPRRTQLGLGLGQVGLGGGVLAQGAAVAPRGLFQGQPDEVVQHGAGHAQGEAGETAGEEIGGLEAVQPAGLAHLGEVVPHERVFLGHEPLLDGEGIAGRAAESDHVPHVFQGHFRGGQEHYPVDDAAVLAAPGRAVRLLDGTVGSQPGGMAAATGEGPAARHAVAALRDHRPRFRLGGAPGQDGAGVAEDAARHSGFQVGRGDRANGVLADVPGGAGVGGSDRLDDGHEGERMHLGAAHRAGKQEPEQPGIDHGVQQRRGYPPLPLDFFGRLGDPGQQRPHPLQVQLFFRGRAGAGGRRFGWTEHGRPARVWRGSWSYFLPQRRSLGRPAGRCPPRTLPPAANTETQAGRPDG